MDQKVVEKIQSFLCEYGKKTGLDGLVGLRTLLSLAEMKQDDILEKAEQSGVDVPEGYRVTIETAHMKVGKFAISIGVTSEQLIEYHNFPFRDNDLERLIECYAEGLLKPETSSS